MIARISIRLALAAAALFSAVAGLRLLRPEDAQASDPGDLWRVVHDLCAPMNRVTGLPLPCLKFDRPHGFAVLRAPGDITRIIVVPTRKIAGVESPLLLRENAQNLWLEAWRHRGAVTAAADRPLAWDDIGMAVNSQEQRTQDQLHIHVDCIFPQLKRALEAHPPSENHWSELDLRPWADRYRVKRLGANGLDRNIFRMIADEIPGARTHMGDHSVAVIGFGSGPGEGFVVMDNGDGGHAEELLDHRCRGDRR